MKEYNPQVAEKMRAIKSEKYLNDLLWRISDAIEEVEQGGLLCSTISYMALIDVWQKLRYYDKSKPVKAEV